MRNMAWVVVVAMMFVLSGCTTFGVPLSPVVVVGSGRLVDKEMSFDGFTRVQMGSAARFEVVRADSFRIVITTDDNAIDYLRVSKAGDSLQIGLKPGSYSRVTLKVKIGMPNLAGLDLSGASRGTISGFRSSGNLDINLSGASSVSGDIEAGDVKMVLSGASEASLSGTGGSLNLNGSGASHARLASFPLKDARLDLSGASSAELDLRGRLDATVSGASIAEVLGNPTMGNIRQSGAGRVVAR